MHRRDAMAALFAAFQAAPALFAQPLVTRQPVFRYEVVRRFPHDPEAFTQGLVFRDGFLFESTGLNGRSSLRRVRLETGEVVQQRAVARRYFAEGLTELKGELFQLTWETEVGFVYDRQTFEPRRTFKYRGEGWGLTHDGTRLIMSDGTATLRFLDPLSMTETGRVRVVDDGRPIEHLNELEFVRGKVFANVWLTDRVAIVDPVSGRVEGWIDLVGLRPAPARLSDAVLNGIAHDAASDRVFVTGKLWPSLFEVRLRPAAP